MTFLRAFGKFWFDFLIGDDWKIAAAVVITLAGLAVLVQVDDLSDGVIAVIGGVAVMVAFTTSLLIDVRQKGHKT